MPERPPREWFYYVVGELKKNPDVKNPKRLAGWLWHHFMKPETKTAILKSAEKLDPDAILKVRKDLITKPKVLDYADFESTEAIGSMIRLLRLKNETLYPELAMFIERHTPKFSRELMSRTLQQAGFTKETKSKHVLRTNKFSIFVYI